MTKRRPALGTPAAHGRVPSAPALAVPATMPPAGPRMLVALDVDGTIVDYDGSMTPAVYHAIRRLAELGTHVVLSTGRGAVAVKPILDELGIREGWAVCSNGAMSIELSPEHDGGFRVVDAVTFDPGPVVGTLAQVLPKALLMVEDATLERWVTAPFPPGELYGEPRIGTLAELASRPAVRVTLRAPDLEAEDLVRAMAGVGIHGVTYAVGWTAWLDVSPTGVSKASALERLRLELGVEREATVAVGDGTNDHEMFAWAGWSVAMGQATEETRARADAVTLPVREDGLALALEWLLADRSGALLAEEGAGEEPAVAPTGL